MPTKEQFEEGNAALQEMLTWYKDCNLDKLKRVELGEKLSFEPAMPEIERVVTLYRKLLDCDLTSLALVTIKQLTSSGKATIDVLTKIGGFAPEKSANPFPERLQLMEEVGTRWENDFVTVAPVLAYATKSSADFQRLEREARGTLSELTKVKDKLAQESSDILEKMNSALSQVQDAAKEAGVSQHATHFNDEAIDARTLAIVWLISSVIFGIATVCYIVYHVEPALIKLDDPTALQLIQTSIPRLIIVFVLTFGMIWSAKNFSAAFHNYVVNRHRRNALASFQTFVEGTSNPEVKDAVLMQATHSIFMPQDSGYSKIDIPSSPNQVVEVFRGMGKESSK